MTSRVRDSIPERVVPPLRDGSESEISHAFPVPTRNEEVPKGALTETRALRPFARFPRALLSLPCSSVPARSHQGRAAEAAPRVLIHLRLKRRDVRSPRRAARSARGS